MASSEAMRLGAPWRRRTYRPGTLAEYHPGRTGDPLARAVRWGAAGVHLPVWPAANGELYVGTGDRQGRARTVRRSVLEPLLRRVAAVGGEIYPGCAQSFDLVLELPGDATAPAIAARAYQLLDAELRDHATILTRWTGSTLLAGPVTVTLTGALSPRALLAAQDQRCAFADGTFDDVGSWSAPPDLVPLISEHWSWRFGWDGREPMSPEERHLLHGLVREAHADGRRVRFFGVPERPRRVRAAFLTELSAGGVDLIGVRHLRALSGVRRPLALPAPRRSRGPAAAHAE